VTTTHLVFGLNASPFLLNGTIRHHLATFAEMDPILVKRMGGDQDRLNVECVDRK